MAERSNSTGDSVNFSVDDTAEGMFFAAIQEHFSEIEVMFSHVLGKIACAIEQNFNDILKTREKITRKIRTFLSRALTKLDNAVTAVVTPISVTLYDQFNAMEWQLKQVLLKLGVLQPHQEVTPTILDSWNREVDPSFIGTMKLDIEPLRECLCAIVEVLKEIRDRLPGVPVENPGELTSEELPEEFQSIGSELPAGSNDESYIKGLDYRKDLRVT